MALSTNPISTVTAAASSLTTSIGSLPSAPVVNSLEAGSALLGGATSSLGALPLPNFVPANAEGAISAGTIASITSAIPSPPFVNPLAKLVAGATESVAAALPNPANALSLAGLNSTISQLSGAVGSGLNGLTGNLPSVGGLSIGSAATTALGGISNTVQNALGSAGGAISSLQSVAGSISNVTADISGALNKVTGGSIAGGLQSLTGSISATAGMISNILSLKRGINLPAGGELFKQSGAATMVEANSKNDWRVRISTEWSIFGAGNPLIKKLQDTGGVVWPFTPSVTVSTKANYTQIDTTHSNYPHMAYKNSQVDEIQISGEFSCETEADAAYWIAATTFFKSSTKMFFGQGDNAGNPPIICRLNGYGASIFNNVPVVVKSFSVDLPEEVNYIKCDTFGTNTWVPVISTISVTVAPIYNRANLRKFNLQEYAAGKALSSSETSSGYI